MLATRQENARSRSDFYRDKYQNTLRRLLFSVSLMVVLIAIIIYQVIFRAPPNYFATTTEGEIIPLIVASPGK